MVFSSLSFLFLFLPILLVIYFIAKDKYKNYILLFFSLIFYSWGEPKYVFLMIISILLNYFFALRIEKENNKKIVLIISIFTNLGLLFYFKYWNFFSSNLNSLFHISLKRIENVLPIGISFYTFQELSYLIDVYRKKIKAQKNIFILGTYIAFFPQLIAGPIVRYKDIEKQLKKRIHSMDKFCDGARRFIIGFSKKIIIANNVAIVSDCIISQITDLGFTMIVIGTIAFSIQIYYDFSGYSDMAIGLAKMFGFEIKENFNYPYSAISIKDFWKRWHISLSSWFKEYVYIPLGGNRVNKIKLIRNILIVWILTGLWHGANWNYIIWGLYYAMMILIENGISKYINRIPILIKWIVTFILINIGWLIFKVENIYQLKIIIKNIITLKRFSFLDFMWSNYNVINYFIFIIIGIIFMFPITKYFKKYETKYMYCIIRDIVLIILLCISICSLINNSYNPFLYFRF